MDPENRFSMPEEAEQEIIKLHAPLISNPHPLHVDIRPKLGISTFEPTGPPTPQVGPVINFGTVATGIYRSSFPQPCNLDHLQSLKLKTIITLVEETYALESTNYVQSNGIEHLRIPIVAHKSFKCINALDKIAEVQAVLRDASRHPVLVHCNKGKHRTGCMIAAFRKVNGEPEENIIDEYAFDSLPSPLLQYQNRPYSLLHSPNLLTVLPPHRYRRYAGAKRRTWDEHFIKTFDFAALNELLRVGSSSLAGSLIVKDYAERMTKANKQAQEALEYATPPRSSDEDDSPWPPSDLKWECEDGTRVDMNPS